MNKHIPSLSVLCLAVVAIGGLTGCNRDRESDPIARGRHLVENVAMCVDCHTPRLPDGRLDPDKPLQGSPLPFTPTVPMPWANIAPSLAGLPTYPDDEAAIKFLMTGQTNHGAVPRPPMPSFRMTRDEAQDVVAYLRSLATPKS